MARQYTQQQRANALAMLKANGYPDREGALTKTARALGIPKTTLSGWARGVTTPPPAAMVAEVEQDLKSLIEHELQAIFEYMKTTRQEASYRDLATAFGIFTDKLIALQHGGVAQSETVLKVVYDETRERLRDRLTDLYNARVIEN